MDISKSQDEEKAKLDEKQLAEREEERLRLQKEADDAHAEKEKLGQVEIKADGEAQK